MLAFAGMSFPTDPIGVVFRLSKDDVKDYPSIYRDGMLNLWVLDFGKDTFGNLNRYSGESMTACYLFMRTYMKQRNISPVKNGVQLDQLDEFLFG